MQSKCVAAVLPDGKYEVYPYLPEGRGPWPSDKPRILGDYVTLMDGKIEDPTPIMKLAFDIEFHRHIGTPMNEARNLLRAKYPEFFTED